VQSVSFGGRTYQVNGSVANADIERVRNQPQNKDVQKVVGGAVLGAIAGQILGKSTKSTVVGAAAGAAAGAGVAAGTANYEGCLPDGGNLTVTLNAPLQVKIT
jgi:outer membrane lipoprotein SlyB